VRRLVPLALVAASLGPPARAEIALLASGQTLKLDGHRAEGDLVVLVLRGGGEVGVPAWSLRGVVPDEVLDEVLAGAASPAGSDLRALAEAAARRHGLDPGLVAAVVAVESAFRPAAVSPKGAQGLMQLMPGTSRALGVRDPLDPTQNLDGGARHLGELLGLYEGDLTRALAAYNAGPGAVARHGGVPPYRETRDYVRRVLAKYRPAKREAAPPPGETATRAPGGSGE
jgi:soluble lytic murein transglycosylase-like protein